MTPLLLFSSRSLRPLCCFDVSPVGTAALIHANITVSIKSLSLSVCLSRPLSSAVLRAAVGRVHLVAAGGAGQHRELDAAQTGAGQPEGVPGHTPGENTHTCWHTHTQVL